MNDYDFFSNSHDEDNKDLSSSSFDLNAFSSGAAEEAKKLKKGDKKDKRKKSTKERIIKAILTVFLIGVITVSIIAGSFLVYAFTAVDGTMNEDLDDLKLNFTTTIYVKNESGNWEEYQRLHGEFNRIWKSYDRTAAEALSNDYTGIPQNLVDAFVAIEDKRFFSHKGVDWKRTVSAFANLFLDFYSSKQGGSTITQQLVKNLTKDDDTKISRKVREIMRARYLESHYAKDTIIECYLNTIAMGHGIYGVEVASNYYFDKSVHELTLNECAALAAITKSPSYYAPDDKPENNEKRRKTVLYEMKAQGYITEEEYEEAINSQLNVVASKDALNETEVNSYFVDALIRQVTNDLAEKYDYDDAHAAANFYSGGYKIYCTVNPNIQNTVDTVFSNSSKYGIKGKDGQTLQGAITVMDYEGHVLGLAGGIGQKAVNLGMSGFNRATDAIRQPGSTMKPIGAYAPALENNMITYSTLINDTSAKYNGWTPVNWYKGHLGNITVQHALERSVNTIPVYLVNKLTPQVSYDFLTKDLGITTLNAEDINLSPLGMGGTNGGLTTFESAAAYAVFGNGGLYYEPTLYTKVTDQHGDPILTKKTKPELAISEDTATVMNHLLQQVVYGSQGTGAGARSYIPNMRIFAKTGTSNDQNDLWFVGGSPYYVASCWCGYDKQQAIPDSAIAMKMWGAVMSDVHKGLEAKTFENSPYASCYYYCRSTGQLATSSCPSKSTGWYKKGNIPSLCKTHSGSAIEPPKQSEVDTQVPADEKKENQNENENQNQNQTEGETPQDNTATQ